MHSNILVINQKCKKNKNSRLNLWLVSPECRGVWAVPGLYNWWPHTSHATVKPSKYAVTFTSGVSAMITQC